ncbi:hypothetical protein QJQ45_026136, partial [Haematococcus lacustris]
PSGSCPCPCNYAVDDSCTCRDLASPLQVSLTKTPMVASYPMQYLASFNFKPVEVVVRPSSRQCNAGDYESSPTCGWYYVDGQQIPSSQGFTCQCSTSQIFDATLGGSNERTRANLDCDFWSNPLDILTGRTPCSAHCLDFDPLWYSGYQLGAPTMQFAISIAVDVPASSISASIANASSSQASSHAPPAPALTTAIRHLLQANSSGGVAGSNSSSSSDGAAPAALLSSEVLTLSPSVPLALSSSRLVSAKLLGDLATYTQLPAISNMVLLVPRPAGWSPDQILAGDRSQWLLLESSQFSMDGSQCDKVGTSFSAFRYQVDGCARAPQTCLGGQIKDLMAADALRISRGRVPLNLLTRYTYGANSTFRSFNGGPLSFALPVTSQSTSLLLLSVSADAVRLVTNSAPGAITGTLMCTFNSVQCGGFEAGASRGYLWVNLTSLGSLAATFTLVHRLISPVGNKYQHRGKSRSQPLVAQVWVLLAHGWQSWQVRAPAQLQWPPPALLNALHVQHCIAVLSNHLPGCGADLASAASPLPVPLVVWVSSAACSALVVGACLLASECLRFSSKTCSLAA